MAINISEHQLVPEQILLKPEEKESVLEEFKISQRGLPKIFEDDPAIAKLGAKAGDIIKIVRKSRSAGTAVYYRVVVNQ